MPCAAFSTILSLEDNFFLFEASSKEASSEYSNHLMALHIV